MFWPKKKTVDDDLDLVEVWVASGMLQAEIVKGKLETNGIPVLLKYESLGPVIGLTVDGLGEVQVMVPIDKEDQARALLAESDDQLDDDWPDEEQ
jgi:hypothetical protein